MIYGTRGVVGCHESLKVRLTYIKWVKVGQRYAVDDLVMLSAKINVARATCLSVLRTVCSICTYCTVDEA